MALIAEDILLLLLDDDTGKLAAATVIDNVLGGAVLIELALDGAVQVRAPERWLASSKVHPIPGRSPAEEVLRSGLATIAEKPRSAQSLVALLGKGRKDQLLKALAARGLVRQEESRVLGVFPRRRWPATDSAHEEQLRAALRTALIEGREPEPRTAAIIAIMLAADQIHKIVVDPAVAPREIKRRAKEIADGAWAATAVRDAIQAANAAMVAVIAAGATAAGS